jgi:hypothetical protein
LRGPVISIAIGLCFRVRLARPASGKIGVRFP